MTFFSGSALIGGLIIGLAAFIFLLFLGRIMGVSGIVGNLMTRSGFTAWRALFVIGVMLAPWVYRWVTGSFPEIEISSHGLLLVIAGLLVGIGSSLGSGCTSGHSICGISRYSPSSVLITILFMVAGGITVFIVKHLLGL